MVIGFRCTPKEIIVVALDGTKKMPKLLTRDRLVRPKNLSDPAFYSWLRKEITDLLKTNDPRKVVYKKAEHSPHRSSSTERRALVEAILELAAYDCDLKQVKGLTKAQLAAALQFEGKPKDVLDALTGTPLAAVGDDGTKEAALAALSVL